MKPFMRVIVTIGAIIGGTFTAERTNGQVTWTGGGSTGVWNDAGNWSSAIASTGTSLVFSGNPTFTSSTNNFSSSVTAGSITFGNNGTAGQTATFTLSGSAMRVGLNAITTTATASGGIVLSDTVAVPLTMSQSETRFTINTGHDVVYTGDINGPNSTWFISKNGGGMLTLTGSSNMGGIRLGAGSASVSRIGMQGVLSPTGTTFLAFGNSTSSGTLLYTGSGEETDKQIRIGSGGNANETGAGTIRNEGSGPLVFKTATFGFLATTAATTRTITLSGSNADDNRIAGTIINTNSTSTFTSITKAGSGRWILSGTNLYTGPTTVTAGTLVLRGGAAVVDTGTVTVSGGELVLDSSESIDRLSITGAGSVTTGSAAVLTAASILASNSSGTATIGVGLAGPGATLTKSASGVLVLSGSNSFSGATRIGAGGLVVGNANALHNSTLDMNAADSGTVSFSQASTVGGLSGSRNLDMGTRTLSIGNNNANTIFSGALSNGALTKLGSGDLTLSGSNSYAGATLVTGGRLVIVPGGSINSTSGVTIDGGSLRFNSATPLSQSIAFGGAGGTLSGTGVIGTALTFGTGAVLSPGNSPGTLTADAGVTWSPGGTYEWETNSLSGSAGISWDLLAVTAGGLNLSGLSTSNTFNLNLITLTGSNTAGPLDAGYVAGSSYDFLLASFDNLSVPLNFSNAANSDLTGLFTIDLSGWQGTQPNISDVSVKVNSAGTGISLVIVPEPGTGIVVGIGIAIAGWYLSRRRRTP